MRVVLYCRVSTDEQARSGYSISEQSHQLETYAATNELTVVERISDEGYSGASPERPGLARVMELAEAGAIDGVLATKRDRLYRSRLYRLLMDQDLKEFGVKLISLNDTGNQLADGFQDEFAAYERDQITQRTNAGKRQKARSGRIVAGPYPAHGFKFSEDRDYYEVDEAAMLSVRRLFEIVASGVSVSATARSLTEEGYPAPRARRWLRPAVREIIFDDLYAPHGVEEVRALVTPEVSLTQSIYGVWYYNRREFVKTRRGRKLRYKPRAEWIAVPVPDAGVPRETVEAARAVLSRNERMPKSSAAGRAWELSGGVLRCSGCGTAMMAVASSTYHTLTNGEKKRYPKYAYRCDARRRGQECESPVRSRGATKTEALVWTAVRDALLQPDKLLGTLERASKVRRRKPESRRLEGVLARLEELEKRRGGLVDLAADGYIPRSELRRRLPALDAEMKLLRVEMDELEGERKRTEGTYENTRILLARMKAQAPDRLDALAEEGRRLLYRDLELTVLSNSDGTLTLTWLAGSSLGEIRSTDDVKSRGSTTSLT